MRQSTRVVSRPGKGKEFGNPQVAAVFAAYPRVINAKLQRLRKLIFEVAATTQGVGPLEETLKWGLPSYLTTQSGSGSTIRLDQVKSKPGYYAMYFHCQTTLVETFRDLFRNQLHFEGNRCILLKAHEPMPLTQLRECIALALTYHLAKQATRASR
jgi:Domain of unknown function (DU1801)